MPDLYMMLNNLLRKGGHIGPFTHKGARPDSARPQGEIERLFWSNTGTVVHKWHHYLPLYDRYLAPWKGKPVKVLEIGVSKGGSLDLWRKFFGPEAVIYGIDINPDCAAYNGVAGQVRIGSQTDADFLGRVVDEMGGLDIVIDDGSHVSPHIRASLGILYPRLADGGIYIAEDLHAAYWWRFGGGYRRRGSALELVKSLIDDMHHWYHGHGQKFAATAGHLAGIHVHDSFVVLEKAAVARPAHSRVGVVE